MIVEPFAQQLDPIARFQAIFARAREAEPFDITAAALATVDADGRPRVRMVLIRGVSDRGFEFHTNRNSEKGRDLLHNAQAAICFHYPALGEQIRVEGAVSLLSDAESDAYFASRPRGNQLSAWASLQSEPLPERGVLVARYAEMEARFGQGPIPRPSHWGGFRLEPRRIEFWKSEESRLHQRVEYVREESGYRVGLLFP